MNVTTYLTDDKSKSVQVMAWCCQATSHYLSQCWPRSMLPYGITRPQWVKLKILLRYFNCKLICCVEKTNISLGWFFNCINHTYKLSELHFLHVSLHHIYCNQVKIFIGHGCEPVTCCCVLDMWRMFRYIRTVISSCCGPQPSLINSGLLVSRRWFHVFYCPIIKCNIYEMAPVGQWGLPQEASLLELLLNYYLMSDSLTYQTVNHLFCSITMFNIQNVKESILLSVIACWMVLTLLHDFKWSGWGEKYVCAVMFGTITKAMFTLRARQRW